MKRSALIIGATLVVAALAGCSATSTSTADSTKTATSAAQVEVQRFGASHLYDDGTRIATTALEDYSPHKWSGNVSEGGTGVLTTITITNGTASPMFPFLYPVARSGGVSTEPVGGSVDGLGITQASPIAPGATLSFQMGFSVADRDDVTIPVSPNPGYEPVVFSTVPRGKRIPNAPRYTERGVPVDDDVLCNYWQSETVIPLMIDFEEGAVDPTTGGFVGRQPELAAATDEDVARFKQNVMSTAPREGCTASWSSLDYEVNLARQVAADDAAEPPATGDDTGSSSGGGTDVDVHVHVDLPNVADCWKLWRPRCW